MVYASIDIETSGLDEEKNCVLSIGAIIEDTEKQLPFDEIPKFNAMVIQREISGAPRALNMNRDLITTMGEYIEGKPETKRLLEENSGFIFCEPHEVVEKLFLFMFEYGCGYNLYEDGMDRTVQRNIRGVSLPIIGSKTKPITFNAAGKNFGTFDKKFLEKLPRWQQLFRVRQRILDPAILFCDFRTDEFLPSLSICKERAGMNNIVTHNALEDAWDVIMLLRTKY